MAMSDVGSSMGAPLTFAGAGLMAALRGIPDEPPRWLVKEAWKRAGNSRYVELQVLEKFANYDAAVGITRMYQLDEARKKCKHEFEEILVHGKPMAERVCGKCGTLESMTLV